MSSMALSLSVSPYFISPLKKREESDERYCRTCTNGTWRGQTSAKSIKKCRDNPQTEEIIYIKVVDFIIHDQQAEVDNTTSLMHGEHYLSGGNQINDQILWNSTYGNYQEKQIQHGLVLPWNKKRMVKLRQLQRHGADDIGSNDFWETLNGILGDN
ncbi:hypothetical protein HAX54_028065 [Datura stramonium]|uniref:Uncharacterized protein n=1 Tax=Datura stramonium TaxID=4076 RepID=A0ABS8S9B0_DATST|nr:hypothetical protein [Datura stramonium]